MKIFKIIALILVLTGSLASCKNRDSNNTNENPTGLVIGYYNNGFYSILIQVDKKYPIGKTIKYIGSPAYSCITLPHDGTYLNVIQVQGTIPIVETTSKMMNKRISFSYRPYQYEEDDALFSMGIGNGFCCDPDVPIYVITDYQIIN